MRSTPGSAMVPPVAGPPGSGPVFVPRTAMPEPIQPWLALNPITIPIEQARRVIFDGLWPEWDVLGLYALGAVAVYLIGLTVFNMLKKGFADVL